MNPHAIASSQLFHLQPSLRIIVGMATRVMFWLDYRDSDPWAETAMSFELHACHGPPDIAHAWIVDRIQAGPLKLFMLLTAEDAEVVFCPETVTAFLTWR